MATLTLRRAAVTYSRDPKGMKAWQLLLDWLTPAERARLTRAANCLYDYKITIFPMTPERYISLPFTVGWGGGGVSWLFLIITSRILPHVTSPVWKNIITV